MCEICWPMQGLKASSILAYVSISHTLQRLMCESDGMLKFTSGTHYSMNIETCIIESAILSSYWIFSEKRVETSRFNILIGIGLLVRARRLIWVKWIPLRRWIQDFGTCCKWSLFALAWIVLVGQIARSLAVTTVFVESIITSSLNTDRHCPFSQS